MEIGLTDGLRKFAKLPPLPAAEEDDLLFCWDATRIQDGGRSLLVMTNASNRICAITRMAGADWRKIDKIASELVRAALETCSLHSWNVESYMKAAGDARLTKTHGRKPVGNLNDLSRMIYTGAKRTCQRRSSGA